MGGLWAGGAVLHPIPAPPTAATTAMRTMYAAIRLHTEDGGGGGAGIHADDLAGASDVDGGSSVWSGGVSMGCPGSAGFSSDIWVCPPVILWNAVLGSRLPRQAVGGLDDSLTSAENT